MYLAPLYLALLVCFWRWHRGLRKKEVVRYKLLDLRFRILERTVRLSKLEERARLCAVKSPKEAQVWQAGATRVRSEILRLELKLENILASKE